MSVKLYIVTPGEARGPFTYCLSSLITTTIAAGVEVIMINPRGSDLIYSRTHGAKMALEDGATHILWIDSDMVMEADAALQFLAHDKPVVAANYVMKNMQYTPVTTINGSRVSSVDKTGLESVTAIGMGFVLVKAEVFRKIMFPWFGHRWFYVGDESESRCQGIPEDWDKWPASFEDSYFSDRLRDAGYDILIDHDVSRKIGHYGNCVYYDHGIVAVV